MIANFTGMDYSKIKTYTQVEKEHAIMSKIERESSEGGKSNVK